ncbi:MAG: DegV family protein [Oscillospiraceae bacterium]|nr:DegV family protein [Oscillospiraceae bacterium]
MSYQIVTDSSADLSPKQVEEYGLEVIPLTLTLEGKDYKNYPDGREIGFQEFYNTLRGGKMSTTSQVNAQAFKEYFKPLLKNGDILYLGFSSGLSGTVNSGRMAAEELEEYYPDRKIIVVDTLAASLGQGLLVDYACRMKREGKSIDEVAAWVENNKLRLAHWFTVDDLNHLKRGGRVSGAAAFFGTMLNIKPVLHVDDEGHLIPMEKVRGRKASLDALVDHMIKTGEDLEQQVVFISHGDCLTDAEYVEEQVKKRCHVKDVKINYVGPVIGSHSGPGTMALFFLAKNRD